MAGRRLFPILLLVCAAPVFFAGIVRELPYYWDADERLFVLPAVRMAATGDLDPYWFGNPGSTVIYPLAALIHIQCVVSDGCRPFEANRGIRDRFHVDPAPFFEIGRGLSATYGVLSLLLVWFLGLRAFSRLTAVVAALWATLPAVALVHSQTVRTDSAGTFWGLLALLLVLRAGEARTVWRYFVAGAAIGVAVATRYFMVALVGVLGALAATTVRTTAEPRSRRPALPAIAAGFAAIPLAFLLVTPYFLPEIADVLSDLRAEARGGIASRPIGNLLYYLGSVVPRNVGWPVTLLAGYGTALAFARGSLAQRLVALFVPLFLGAISFGGLHWSRWVVPALPSALLLAAHGLEDLMGRLRLAAEPLTGRRAAQLLFPVALICVSAFPVRLFAVTAMRQGCRTTRILARDWAVDALPAGASLVIESGTLPLLARNWEVEGKVNETGSEVFYEATVRGKPLRVRLVPALAGRGRSLDDYRSGDPTYIVARVEPEVLSQAPAFYAALRREASVLARFESSWFRAGPDLEVYRLPARKTL
jgi:hypothetical protein